MTNKILERFSSLVLVLLLLIAIIRCALYYLFGLPSTRLTIISSVLGWSYVIYFWSYVIYRVVKGKRT